MTRNSLFSFIIMALSCVYATATDFPYQSCTYSISCHCDFIHDTAAYATVGSSCYGGNFYATLDGSSIPIFGTVFCINDTLQARYTPANQTVAPASESVQYISGYYRKPHEGDNRYSPSPSTYRNIWGGGYLSADASTMECVNLTADMLCMFYYAKTADFGQMQQGSPQDISIVMPDGEERTLQVTFNGMGTFNGNNVYNLTANFTYGGCLSAYPISVLIDPEMGIPVEFVANIDIGQVIMAYQGE